ncbi:MAG: hypothetical protein RI958_972 [Actinomycetota bacterium]|jgi:spore germination protein GerM
MRRFTATAFVMLVALSTGCAIAVDDAPRDIATEADGAITESSGQVPTAAGGSGRIYLVTGGGSGQAARIQSVTRDLDDDVDAAATALLAGPNIDETTAGLRTAIPPELTVSDVRRVGNVVVVDVSPELGELAGTSLVLALAQIVCTFDSLDGVEGVSVTIGGEPRAWPDGTGDLSDLPLSSFDYPGLERTSQPDYPATPGD